MEPLNTGFAKAVDDLSVNIFIPALISSLLVEIGPWIQQSCGTVCTYLIILCVGWLTAALIVIAIVICSSLLPNGTDIGPILGVSIMPLGFAGIFPDHFAYLHIPYSQVTGIAILAWAFMLVRGARFFHWYFGEDLEK